jgi:hypothetical protein
MEGLLEKPSILFVFQRSPSAQAIHDWVSVKNAFRFSQPVGNLAGITGVFVMRDPESKVMKGSYE